MKRCGRNECGKYDNDAQSMGAKCVHGTEVGSEGMGLGEASVQPWPSITTFCWKNVPIFKHTCGETFNDCAQSHCPERDRRGWAGLG